MSMEYVIHFMSFTILGFVYIAYIVDFVIGCIMKLVWKKVDDIYILN